MQYIQTPHDAELNAAEVMKAWGFGDAVATTGGADGGIDVRSKRALAQVKWRGGLVGRPEVQQLYGARGNGDELLFFFAASGYSEQAVKYADQVGVSLFTYDPIGLCAPANVTASRFADGVASGPSPSGGGGADIKFVSQLLALLIALVIATTLLFLFV